MTLKVNFKYLNFVFEFDQPYVENKLSGRASDHASGILLIAPAVRQRRLSDAQGLTYLTAAGKMSQFQYSLPESTTKNRPNTCIPYCTCTHAAMPLLTRMQAPTHGPCGLCLLY